MKKLLLSLFAIIILSSCAQIQDKTKNIKLQKDCDGGSGTLADVFCKKK